MHACRRRAGSRALTRRARRGRSDKIAAGRARKAAAKHQAAAKQEAAELAVEDASWQDGAKKVRGTWTLPLAARRRPASALSPTACRVQASKKQGAEAERKARAAERKAAAAEQEREETVDNEPKKKGGKNKVSAPHQHR